MNDQIPEKDDVITYACVCDLAARKGVPFSKTFEEWHAEVVKSKQEGYAAIERRERMRNQKV